MDKGRTEEAWKTLLMPYDTSLKQVSQILFGSTAKDVQSTVDSTARYALSDFAPTSEDEDLIPFLQFHLLKRRENIILVGPAGCGKSCLIQTLTMQYGVQYFGTADELKQVADNVSFIVFDDFDFKDMSVDDIKRLLDREFATQRVKVRYHDASLSNKMTRIVLCNELPAIFEDDAVKDRFVILLLLMQRIIIFNVAYIFLYK